MIDTFLLPLTTVTANGDGPAVEIAGAAGRTFLLTLLITNILEQESLDVSVFGSPDGSNWSPKPLAKVPQKFYRGEHPLLLDLTGDPDAKFLRAHWEVARWGRGEVTPAFEFSLQLREVPAEVLSQAAVALGTS